MKEEMLEIDIGTMGELEEKYLKDCISNYKEAQYEKDEIIDIELNIFNENFHLIKNNDTLKCLTIRGGLPDIQLFKKLSILSNLESIEFSNLSTKDIGTFDDILKSLQKLKSLKKLNINNFDTLKVLPSSICNLTQLKELRVYFTGIEYLPNNIGDLINLKDLDIPSNNAIKTLPKSFLNLKSLETLTITDELIGEITVLKKNMPNLKKVLNMSEDFKISYNQN